MLLSEYKHTKESGKVHPLPVIIKTIRYPFEKAFSMSFAEKLKMGTFIDFTSLVYT